MNHYYARLCVVAFTAACLLSLVTAAGAVTYVVRPNNLNGWAIAFQTSYGGYPVGAFIASGPDTPPEGVGAFHIQTENPYPTPSDYLQKVYLGTNRHTGVLLSDITKFKYYTYLHARGFDGTSGKPGGEPPVVEIITDTTESTQQRVFQYQPYGWDGTAGNPVSTDTWQEWDLLAANDGNYHWGMVYWVDSGNVWGDWNWVRHRYDGGGAGLMKLATPNVGDIYGDGYDPDYRVSNQTGTSLSIKVGACKAGYKTYDPTTVPPTLTKPWPQYQESAGIDGYADRLVIEAGGVEYVYDFEGGKAPSVGINNKAAKDAVIGDAASQWAFVVWGKVLDDPWPDYTVFYLDDGSGPIKVVASDNVQLVQPGQYWRAEGYLDNTTNPPTLSCTASYLYKLK